MGNTKGTQGPKRVLTKQQRIAEIARKYPKEALTALSHHIDEEWLCEAYRGLRKDAAPGVDRQTVEEYGRNLHANVGILHERVKSGSYKAPPVRRSHIPKGVGKKETRPIGIPTTEDKLLQRAIVMVLTPIYEQIFCSFSYGFREGRSAHQALEYLWKQIRSNRIQWVLDLDIRKFFDRMVHSHLREITRKRVRDGVTTRLIDKWLKAGVLEGQRLYYPPEGTPQGGPLSPMLSNIYLHEVLDRWYETEVRPRMKGRTFMVRFADDAVLGFEREEDAERVMRVIGKRLARYGLSLHPEKTRLLPFGRPGQDGSCNGENGRNTKPHTFDYLGFTHYWGKSRSGKWVVKRKTARDRYSRGLAKVKQWCGKNRHLSMQDQHKALGRKLQGHFAYYGITGNGPWLERFREEVKKIWHKWLNRRSRRRNDMSWDRFSQLVHQLYKLPPARVVHSIYVARP
jgi:RNA-directed DNA polymerase